MPESAATGYCRLTADLPFEGFELAPEFSSTGMVRTALKLEADTMRILLVEDEKKVASFVSRGLKEAGYVVDHAESAASADVFTAENEYDLVILDVMLPDRNGFDVARQLRGDGFAAPILMLTALASTKDKVHGLDAGADDYLPKPFAFEELLARIRALLRRNGPGGITLLRFADLEVSLITRKVSRAGKEIVLTAKEFSLLEYFIRNPNRPVTRTEISEHVWNIQFDTQSNVIDVSISLLRKKIDHDFGKKLIHTVVGVGYVLREE